MSGKYISRDMAKEALYKTAEEYDEYDKCDRIAIIALNNADEILNDIPAADVVEVRHGRWIKDDETGEPICSVCYSGKPTRAVCSSVIEHKLNNHEIRHCYYCGAKMDGGQDDV